MIPDRLEKLTANLHFVQQTTPPFSDTGVVHDRDRQEANTHSKQKQEQVFNSYRLEP